MVSYRSHMTTPSATASEVACPRGREEVVDAILVAAADLFAERGPTATSIRDVAARAGVNHGLVYRHFGTKDQLVGAVLTWLGSHFTALIASSPEPSVAQGAIDRHLRVIARVSLDGFPVGELQSTFPNVALILDPLLRRHGDDRETRLAAAHSLAVYVSWCLFGDFLRAATGLKDVPEADVQASILAAAAALCAAPGHS